MFNYRLWRVFSLIEKKNYVPLNGVVINSNLVLKLGSQILSPSKLKLSDRTRAKIYLKTKVLI